MPLDTVICYQCGVRRPNKGMILVGRDAEEKMQMWFCNWHHFMMYATSEYKKMARNGLMECNVCGKPATIRDTEYDENYCDRCAEEYEVTEGPHERIEDAKEK